MTMPLFAFSFYDSTFTVAVSFLLFIAILVYLGVPRFLGKALDDRADAIRTELAEAKQLRDDAQELFASFERKQKEVAGQTEEIVAHAKAEAEAAAARAKEELKVSIARRLKAADDQIALAEANAVREVKDKAVAVAIAAATEILQSRLDAKKASGLVDGAIEEVAAKLH